MNKWNSGKSDGQEVGKKDVVDALATVVKAMANGHRLELIELLAQGEHSVEALAQRAGMGVTSTSAHLQILKRAGLVMTRREGTTIHHRLAGDDVAELYVAAKRVAMARSAVLRDRFQAFMDQPAAGPATPTIRPQDVTPGMTVLDVRPRDEYLAGHLPGAISIPFSELPDRYGEIPSDRQVVLYCRGQFCRFAREGATWLRDRGFRAVAMDQGVVELRADDGVVLDAA